MKEGKEKGGGGRLHGGWDGERVREQEGWGSARGTVKRQRGWWLKLQRMYGR